MQARLAFLGAARHPTLSSQPSLQSGVAAPLAEVRGLKQILSPHRDTSLPSQPPARPSSAATFKASGLLCSGRLATLSAWMVSVKAGHGDECAYLERLEKSS